MPHDLLLFITWKTFRNLPLLDEPAGQFVSGLLPILARKEGATVEESAVLPDHVHVVLDPGPRSDLPRLLQRLKGESSFLVNRDQKLRRHIRWASGYDARSIGRRHLDAVINYFNAQKERHGAEWVVRYRRPSAAALAG
jgi:REP element-mobilizing transposase RayT